MLCQSLLGLLGLLWQKNGLDVWQYTALCDSNTGQQLVQFLVVADGQLQVTGDDPGLLVDTGGVSCQFQHLGGQVFQDSCEVHWGTSTNSFSVVTLSQETMDSAYWEL